MTEEEKKPEEQPQTEQKVEEQTPEKAEPAAQVPPVPEATPPEEPKTAPAEDPKPPAADKPKEIKPSKRVFVYDGREFQDPDAKMTPDEVRLYFVTFFPELANAEIVAPVARPAKSPEEAGEQIIEFKRRTGTKGNNASPDAPDYLAMQKAMMEKKAETSLLALEMWKTFDENEKTGVRFGMFPYKKMMDAEKAGFNGKELAVALMSIAKENGGMKA